MDNKPKEIMFAYNNINNVFDVVKRAADRIGVKVLNEDINTFTIELEGKGGMFSKGDPITITLEKVKDLQTKIYFDDHSSKGTLSSKNDTIERMKMMVDQLLPKMKMPEESNESNDEMNANNQVPDYTIGNNIQQAVYSNQPMDNYNNQIPDYQNQQMMPEQDMYQNQQMVPEQGMYQEQNMANYMPNANYQSMDNYNNQIPDYQNQQMIPEQDMHQNQQMIPEQGMYQEQNMANYMPDASYQQMPMDNPQIIQQQVAADPNQASDPVNDLMMGKFGGSEPKSINSSTAQSSEKKNSDPLLDFMTNMNV